MLFIQPHFHQQRRAREEKPGRSGGRERRCGYIYTHTHTHTHTYIYHEQEQPRRRQSSATCTPSLQRAKHNVRPCFATGWEKRPRGLRESKGEKAKDEGERASGNRWAARRGRSLCLRRRPSLVEISPSAKKRIIMNDIGIRTTSPSSLPHDAQLRTMQCDRAVEEGRRFDMDMARHARNLGASHSSLCLVCSPVRLRVEWPELPSETLN